MYTMQYVDNLTLITYKSQLSITKKLKLVLTSDNSNISKTITVVEHLLIQLTRRKKLVYGDADTMKKRSRRKKRNAPGAVQGGGQRR